MTIEYNRFAAVFPADTNEADLYALTSGELVGFVSICNQDTVERTYSLAVTDTGSGVAADDEDWVEKSTKIPANTTFTRDVSLKATKTIRIQSGTASTISYMLMGALKT